MIESYGTSFGNANGCPTDIDIHGKTGPAANGCALLKNLLNQRPVQWRDEFLGRAFSHAAFSQPLQRAKFQNVPSGASA